VCPFRVSARSSLPTRIGHTKAAPSHRAGQPARNATRKVRCLFPPFGRHSRILLPSEPKMPTSLPHSHLTMRFAIQTGARCSIRPGQGAYRADLAPVGFNTAPFQRAGDRRSNRYAAFGLSIVFSLALPLRPVTAPAREKARCRARATRPPDSLLTPY
jgi:hypothetical protein